MGNVSIDSGSDGHLPCASVFDVQLGFRVYLIRICSQGEFAIGKRHGFGTLTTSRGDVYEGQWYEGMPHGEGKCIYAGI